MSTKTLGLLGMITSPFLAIDLLISGMYEKYHASSMSGLFNLLYMTGWLCCVVAFYRNKATGKNVIGKAVIIVQVVFLLLAETWNVYSIIQPHADTTAFKLLDMFWPVSNSFMFITGLAIIFAKRLAGWQRYIPIIVGMWLPVCLIIFPLVFGRDTITFFTTIIYSAVAWFLLGLSVYLGKPVMADVVRTGSEIIRPPVI